MQTLETHIGYLPLPYRLAIERLGNEYDKRTAAWCAEFCDAYAATYGMASMPEHQFYKDSACAIAKRRYLIDED